ncbi:TPR-like protein [Dioscorea alata]|uniref:TPR-like protein n=1 Tax=Dioscorea alata TaxID=55571 RepID=A0ACB7WNH7_DIOAL|nr:TPR-like protein [Dioscorea alata]
MKRTPALSCPDLLLFRDLLKSCIAGGDLGGGAALHAIYTKSGIPHSTYFSNHFILLYSKCGLLHLAHQVFDEIPQPNVFSYNALLSALARDPLHSDLAPSFFSRIPNPDLVSFNTLLAFFSAASRPSDALRLFSRMRYFDACIDGFTLSSVISSLVDSPVDPFHSLAISSGLDSFVSVNNALISSYSKGGALDKAELVFDRLRAGRDAVSWNSMIVAYGQHREGTKALSLYTEMVRLGFEVDLYTLASVLTAFTSVKDLQGGAQFHAMLVKCARERNAHVGSGLIDLYSKCGRIWDARKVFDEMLDWDLVLWNTMISGFSMYEELAEEGLVCFRDLQRFGLWPDDCSLVCAISACSNLSSPLQGMQLHSLAMKSDVRKNQISVSNALIAMYSKCGKLGEAKKVFDRMPERNTVSYNSMIAGYAQHGLGVEAVALFDEMVEMNYVPTSVTFVSVLSACAHTRRVEDGRRYFKSMEQDHGIKPGEEHYSCLIDALARAGMFEEAEALISKMPFDLGSIGWAALLGACRIHGKLELGAKAAEKLLQLEPSNATSYVMLSNMYASKQRWEEAAMMRKLMRDRGLKKKPGCSWVELGKTIHVFVAGDVSHPRIKEIHQFLEEMKEKMKRVGYEPDMRWALIRDDTGEGEARLGHHSEKLAVAFGVISTGDGLPILVVKNLRICGDCHNAIKLMSAIVGREITVRDAHRFHCFRDGHCSCGDYW